MSIADVGSETFRSFDDELTRAEPLRTLKRKIHAQASERDMLQQFVKFTRTYDDGWQLTVSASNT
jgi:hypothetical protein